MTEQTVSEMLWGRVQEYLRRMTARAFKLDADPQLGPLDNGPYHLPNWKGPEGTLSAAQVSRGESILLDSWHARRAGEEDLWRTLDSLRIDFPLSAVARAVLRGLTPTRGEDMRVIWTMNGDPLAPLPTYFEYDTEEGWSERIDALTPEGPALMKLWIVSNGMLTILRTEEERPPSAQRFWVGRLIEKIKIRVAREECAIDEDSFRLELGPFATSEEAEQSCRF